MSALTTADLVDIDVDFGTTAAAVIGKLADRIAAAGRCDDADALAAGALQREDSAPTGLVGGIAIPHCRSSAVIEPTIAFARLAPSADFGAADGPADLVFMIAAPADGDADHLKVLSTLARSLVRASFVEALRAAATAEEAAAIINEAVAGAEPKHAATASTDKPVIVAVTACPTGIAHTYMAADALVAAGKRAGVDLIVETQGSSGSTPLDPDVIRRAGAAIFATDVGVKDQKRFAGKPVVIAGVKRGIDEPDKLVAEALAAAANPNARRVEGADSVAAAASATAVEAGLGLRLRQYLLTGVSYMIPFVAAGGLLIALGFLLAGFDVAIADEVTGLNPAQAALADNSLFNLPEAGTHALFGSSVLFYLGALMFLLGGWAFGFLVPALAGYIAYAIADRPGIAPGFVMGYVANQIGAGFIGGIIGGLMAGYIASLFAKREVPRWLAGLMPVVVIPLVTTLITGLLMFLVVGRPVTVLNNWLTDVLGSMNGSSAIALGVVLGLMMAFDLGGPVNKAAYVFAVTGLSAAGALDPGSPQSMIMAAVMIAGMTPPLAMALSSTVLRPKLYSEEERENGKTAWLLGASFITEGAIPFAAADPLRVIPALMLGSATAGAIAMGTGVTLKAPHGGVFVFFAVDHVLWFFVAIIAGTLISAFAVTALKLVGRRGLPGDAELAAV